MHDLFGRPSQRTINGDFLRKKSKRYAYQCRLARRVSPRPDRVEEQMKFSGDFIAVPIDLDIIWGFEKLKDLGDFTLKYSANVAVDRDA